MELTDAQLVPRTLEGSQEAGPLVEGFWQRSMPRQRTAALRIIARQRGVEALPEQRQCAARDPHQAVREAAAA